MCAESGNTAVEDETHFLIDCHIYTDLRNRLYMEAERDEDYFTIMDCSSKLVHIPCSFTTIFNRYLKEVNLNISSNYFMLNARQLT